MGKILPTQLNACLKSEHTKSLKRHSIGLTRVFKFYALKTLGFHFHLDKMCFNILLCHHFFNEVECVWEIRPILWIFLVNEARMPLDIALVHPSGRCVGLHVG
jgi:hypothetical protein